MWFFYEQPDEFLERFEAERERRERIAQLTRALRGSTPPFDAPVQEQLRKAMAEEAGAGRLAVKAR